MAFAACARQSAPGGFKQRSNPTIGCGDIEYLHLLIGQGGKAALVFVPLCLLACAQFEKKGENPRGGHGSEKGVIQIYYTFQID
jgi:hypothetical protein